MIVLVPAYEPDGRLLDLVDELTAAAGGGLHVVVVDDGSGPAYRALFAAVGRRGCRVLHSDTNRGKGRALKTGFAHALAEHPGEEVVCADSDGQHSVVDVLRVAAAVRAGHGHVLGVRRFTGQVPVRSRIGNDATRVLFRLATGRRLVDTQTGLRGYRSDLLPSLLAVPGERFEYELNVLLRAARDGQPLTEVDIATIYLEDNASSHFRPVADSARVYAPLLTFLLSSAGAFVVDAVALLLLYGATGSLVASALGARLLSGCLNFTVNRRLVFGATGGQPVLAAATRYAALAATLLVVNVGLLAGLRELGAGLLLAKAVAEVLLVTGSFSVQSRHVFAPRRSRPEPAAVPAPRTADALDRARS